MKDLHPHVHTIKNRVTRVYTGPPPCVYTRAPLVYTEDVNNAYTQVPPIVYTGDVENYLHQKRNLTEMPDDLNL